MENEYQIGDRVVSNCDYGDLPAGMAGTVVSNDGSYGVDFDDFEHGHNCRGAARNRHGWYIDGDCLDPEEPPAVFEAPAQEFADLFLGGGEV